MVSVRIQRTPRNSRKKPTIPHSMPLRPGTASGGRANNPHPAKSFMVWRFPRRGVNEKDGSQWSEELINERINQVHKCLCQSTYQTDYLGTPQGFQLKSAYTLPPDWKENLPYTLDTVQRYCYQNSTNPEELRLPSSRYGSNKKKHLAATGTTGPTASSRYLQICNRTTYDRHYNDNSGACIQQIRETDEKWTTEALRKYHEQIVCQQQSHGINKDYHGEYTNRKVTPTSAAPPPAMRAHYPSATSPGKVSHHSNTPASTPISTPYVPLPPAREPFASRTSLNVDCTNMA